MRRLGAWLRRQVDAKPEGAVVGAPDVRPSADDLAAGVIERPTGERDAVVTDLPERVAVAGHEYRPAVALPPQGDVEPLAPRPYVRPVPAARPQHLAVGPRSTTDGEARLTVTPNQRRITLVRPSGPLEESHDAMMALDGLDRIRVALVCDGDRPIMRSHTHITPQGRVIFQ